MKPLNILIVDDDHNLAKTLAEGLHRKLKEAIEVTTSFSALEALSILNQRSFDLVISDFKMPGMTGIDLFKRIRGCHPKTVLILITAYGTDALEQEARQLVDAYITKPFEINLLVQFIQKLLKIGEISEKHRILILEDDIYLRQLINKVLKTQNFEVCQAETLQDAKEFFQTGRFDVFISDIQVPDGRGVDLIREYRDYLTQSDTMVILITGEARYRYLEEELGIDIYLEKPVAIQDLLTLVKRLTNLTQEEVV